MSNDSPDPVGDPTQAGHAAREVRHLAPRGMRSGDRSVMGILLVALGVLFLLDNLGIMEARYFFRNFWPLLIVAWGGARLMFGRGGERIAGAVALAFGGLLLGNRLLGWDINVIGLFWPLILIGLGFSMFFRSSNRWPHACPPGGATRFTSGGSDGPDGIPDQSASLSESAIMSGVKRRNVSQAFRGGHVTAIMGSVELDLRECRLASEAVRIDVHVALGQIVMRVPRDWTVEAHVAAVMGNIEDTSDQAVDVASKRLLLEGSAFMGQVEIRN